MPSTKMATTLASRLVFGGNVLRGVCGTKALKAIPRADKVAAYYPTMAEQIPLFRSEERLYRMDKLATLRRRGKGPPKKGSRLRKKK